MANQAPHCQLNADIWPPYEYIRQRVGGACRRIFVVGLDHNFQLAEPADHELLRQDQERLRELFGGLVTTYSVDFIGEEKKHGEMSMAKEEAQKCNLRYRSLDVCPEDFANTWINKPASEGRTNTYDFAWTLVREWHIFMQFDEELRPAQSALLICGRSHIPALSRLLSLKHTNDGFVVVPICLPSRDERLEYRDCCWLAQRILAGEKRINFPPGLHPDPDYSF